MNGEALTPKHGYPVRIIVPGVTGARSVKWLNRITVQLQESENVYQRRDYKRLPPEATDPEAAEKFWDTTPALQDMPVNSIIGRPTTGDSIELSATGTILVRGYALPCGGHGPVVRVEVSANDGRDWQDARIIDGGKDASKWSWSLWETEVKMERGQHRRLLSRAADQGGNMQKADPEWNLRGVGYDGYGEARDLKII